MRLPVESFFDQDLRDEVAGDSSSKERAEMELNKLKVHKMFHISYRKHRVLRQIKWSFIGKENLLKLILRSKYLQNSKLKNFKI